MGNRHRIHEVLKAVPREEAVAKWCGWWRHFVNENYGGSASRASKAIFGKTQSQGNKWMYVDNGSLPSEPNFVKIMKFAKVKDFHEVIHHNYPTVAKPGHAASKSNGAGQAPVFTVDNPDIPKPQMSFASSEEFDGMYEFELSAVLPLSGVLALMAMLDDAHG